MTKYIPEEPKPLSKQQKILLGALAALYIILIILWIANNQNMPIFGIGALEGFNRQPAPVAATAPMTWRFAPGLNHLAVKHSHNTPPAASKIERLTLLETGNNGAKVYKVSYQSDSKLVYGIIGIPSKTPAPAIVVCHPSDTPYQTGLHTQDTVKFLADLGIIAFAPDYQGWGQSQGVRGQEERDVHNAIASLKNEPIINGRIGLLGFSMGGGIAARVAAIDTSLNLLVLYYPQLFGSVEELRNGLRYGQFEQGSGIQQLIQEGKSLQADDAEIEYSLKMISPIYHLYDFQGKIAILHGEKDNVVSIRQSEGLENELKRLGKNVEFIRYPELSHAFANSIENPSKEKLAEIVTNTLNE